MMSNEITIERTYDAPAQAIWELWTTPEGIESWWSPDGFTAEVQKLDLAPDGELVYAMTATGPEQVKFMREAGLPLTTESRKTFTQVDAPTRLAYSSLVDYVPGVEPYSQMTSIDLTEVDGRTRVTMTVEPMHDEVWTGRLVAGRENELDNLGKVLAARA